MAPPPRIRSISRESIPGAPASLDPLFAILNDFMGSVVSALTRNLSRAENFRGNEKVGLRFNSTATATGEVTFRPEIPTSPKHLVCTRLVLENGEPPTTVWSVSWRLTSSGTLAVFFRGLSPSVTYLCNFIYE
jgi:hypothetical protein